MDTERVGRMAALLMEARRTHRLIGAISDDTSPRSVEEAAAVQAEVARQLHAETVGWKVGIPPQSQTYCAPLLAPLVYDSGAEIRAADHPAMLVEGEVAFRMARDLPDRPAPYTEEETCDAVDCAHVAIEIGVWRLADPFNRPMPEIVADNMGNGVFIYGDSSKTWRTLDRTRLHMWLEVNGKTVVDKTGGKSGKYEIVSLFTWLVNHLRSRGGVRKGQIVTTGSWIGGTAASPGDRLAVHIDGIGEVRTTIV